MVHLYIFTMILACAVSMNHTSPFYLYSRSPVSSVLCSLYIPQYRLTYTLNSTLPYNQNSPVVFLSQLHIGSCIQPLLSTTPNICQPLTYLPAHHVSHGSQFTHLVPACLTEILQLGILIKHIHSPLHRDKNNHQSINQSITPSFSPLFPVDIVLTSLVETPLQSTQITTQITPPLSRTW